MEKVIYSTCFLVSEVIAWAAKYSYSAMKLQLKKAFLSFKMIFLIDFKSCHFSLFPSSFSFLLFHIAKQVSNRDLLDPVSFIVYPLFKVTLFYV